MKLQQLQKELTNKEISQHFYKLIVHDSVLAASFVIRAKSQQSFARKVQCLNQAKTIRDSHLPAHWLLFTEMERLVQQTAKGRNLDPVRDWVTIANILA